MNDSRVNFINVDIARIIREAEAELTGDGATSCTSCRGCRESKHGAKQNARCPKTRGDGLLPAATVFDPRTLTRES